MLAFELKTPTTVKLDHAKGRKELHGEVKVLALDLSMTLTTNNRFLDTFAPGWREALFCALPPGAETPPDQAALDLRVSDLPFLRMPSAVYPIKLDKEFSGTLRVDYGRGEDADKVVNVCKLKNFQVTPIEGGSVEIHYSVSSAADITGDMVGFFSEYIQQNITVTILAPVKAEGDLINASSDAPDLPPANGTTQPKPPKKGGKKAPTATEAFVDAHAPEGEGGEAGATTH